MNALVARASLAAALLLGGPARAASTSTVDGAAYDYELDLAAADAEACRVACEASEECCAYVFERQCRLRRAALASVSTGAVSGLKPSCAGRPLPATVAERLKGKEKDFKLSSLAAKRDAYWRTVTIRGSAPGSAAAPLKGLPLEQRALPMTPEVLEYLQAANVVQGYSELPVLAVLDDDYAADFRAALADLPDAVKRKVAEKLKAVLWAADVGTTGFSEAVVDDKGRQDGAFTIIDVERTKVKANEWATRREASPFKPDGAETLTAEFEEPSLDNRSNAVQYILLHEFGHVLAAGSNIHPRWDAPVSTGAKASDYPFFALTWTVPPKGPFESRYASTFAGLPPIRFYRQASSKLSSASMEDVYGRLEKTSFATLYGSTNPFDDFAEAFASYVHVVMLGRPYRIKIAKGGKVVKTYGSCWEEPRCAEKRRFMEALLRP